MSRRVYRILYVVFFAGMILCMDCLAFYFKGYFDVLHDPTIGFVILVGLFLNSVGMTTIVYGKYMKTLA